MKNLSLLLAALPLVLAHPHGPDPEPSHTHGKKSSSRRVPEPVSTGDRAQEPAGPKYGTSKEGTAPTGHTHGHSSGQPPAVAPAVPEAKKTGVTPQGCKPIFTDDKFPSDAAFKAALKGVSRIPKPTANSLDKGLHPDYLYRATTYKGVQDAVKFADKYNIRLSVINSGHDFVGRNDAPSGLLIDVSELQGITVHKSFTPTAKGVPPPGAKANVIVPEKGQQAAVTIGAGLSTQKLNNALVDSKLVTVGAAHGSVTVAGGWGQTSGHSPISDTYGLGSDNFLEFKVVLPNGDLVVANKVANPDLFWALRGGGGSTFGVVVEATVKAHPDMPITLYTWTLNETKPNNPGLWDAYAELHHHFEDFTNKHNISGYYYNYGNRLAGIFLHKAEGSGTKKAEEIWDPIMKKFLSYGDLVESHKIVEYPKFKDYFDARFGKIDEKQPEMAWDTAAKGQAPSTSKSTSRLVARHDPETHNAPPKANPITNLDSRLLGPKHFANPDFKAALRNAIPLNSGQPAQTLLQGHLIGGNKVWHPDDDNAVLPAWRQALTHLIGYKVIGNWSIDSLRKISPDSGAYANEAFPLSENWQQDFWGANYPKLSQLKAKYDPKMLLWVSPGINADYYEVRDNRVCKRLTKYVQKTAPPTDNRNYGRIMNGSIN